MPKYCEVCDGFGRYEVLSADRKVTVEMKSVNHRYLELGIKLPRKLNFLEGTVRTEMKRYVDRGKVDVFITYENLGEGDSLYSLQFHIGKGIL